MGDFNPQLPTKYNGTNKYITFFVTRNRSPTGADYRQPETGTLYALGTVWQTGKNPTTGVQGDLWMLSKIVANVAYWVQIAGGGVGPLIGLTTPHGASPVFPNGMGLINLLEGAGITITGGVNSVTIANTGALNDYHVARFIVSAGGAADGANYTTLAAAYAAAVSAGGNQTVFMQPGTYTVNQTLSSNVNIAAFSCDSLTPNVTIAGTLTHNTAGTVTISGICLQTNSASSIAVTGSAASILNLKNCNLNFTNNNGITFSSSNASSRINIMNCTGDLGTTGIKIFDATSSGILFLDKTNFTNSGGSSTASTITAGIFDAKYSVLLSPITTSGTATIALNWVDIDCTAINTTALTHGGSGLTSRAGKSIFLSGSASTVSISATLVMDNCEINSSNTNAITGAGTINYQCLTFSGSSRTVNTTTQTNVGTLYGIVAGNAPSAGFLGERISSTALAVPVSTGAATTITSISVTPGVWDISINGTSSFSAFVGSAFVLGISTATNTLQGVDGDQRTSYNSTSATAVLLSGSIVGFRVVLAATTTYYVVNQSNFLSGTCDVNARISAVRVG